MTGRQLAVKAARDTNARRARAIIDKLIPLLGSLQASAPVHLPAGVARLLLVAHRHGLTMDQRADLDARVLGIGDWE